MKYQIKVLPTQILINNQTYVARHENSNTIAAHSTRTEAKNDKTLLDAVKSDDREQNTHDVDTNQSQI